MKVTLDGVDRGGRFMVYIALVIEFRIPHFVVLEVVIQRAEKVASLALLKLFATSIFITDDLSQISL